MTLFALHGFLGLPSDWDFLRQVHAIDVLSLNPPSEGLVAWAKAFNKFVNRREGPRLLLGYSMGARLAMHALIDSPELWSGAIFVSGHPGLKSSEKQQRLDRDNYRADRFLQDPWDILMRDWEAQPLFSRKCHLKAF